MVVPARLLALAGALLIGGAVMVVRSRSVEGPVASAGATQAPESGAAPGAPPLPAALAAAAEEDCDTPGKIEPEAAPIAKFMEAPCAPGEEGAKPPASGVDGPPQSAQP